MVLLAGFLFVIMQFFTAGDDFGLLPFFPFSRSLFLAAVC